MRKILNFLVFSFLISLTVSCEKDNITNTYFEENPDRVDAVAQNLRKVLASSPNGWVMMVKPNLNSKALTPIVLKFDTAKNVVDIRTVYGETQDVPAYFDISSGTGSPQLTFTTGSIMSALYRVGLAASEITDHIYNVVSVSDDTVAIRGYRSGRVYTQEGGVIFKLFKRPADWKWAEGDKDRYFDFNDINFAKDVVGVGSSFRIEHVGAPDKTVTFNSVFNTISNLTAAQWNSLRNGFAFALARNIGAGGFKPTEHVYFRFPIGTTIYDGGPIVANNALSFYPGVAGFTFNVTFMTNFINTYNVHYLVCKSVVRTGANVKMEFEAYGENGTVVVKAFYDNLK